MASNTAFYIIAACDTVNRLPPHYCKPPFICKGQL